MVILGLKVSTGLVKVGQKGKRWAGYSDDKVDCYIGTERINPGELAMYDVLVVFITPT